ncbi:hypothetical protein QYS62_011039 [Fusarium acuminatum]|jgi:hypothetical protein|uniref:Uncharacterized protein n=1 Tax=Fusarium acuminatum TaxID=5515 RepID=A0ABZ2XD83_9HYPO
MDILVPVGAAQSVGEGPAEIPDELFSKATIVYVGFNNEKATEIWDGWINWPASPPRREIDPEDSGLEVSFPDWVKGHASYSNNVWEDDTAAWLNSIKTWGIATELRDAIMDKRFKSARLSGTCTGWVRDNIKMRYAYLEAIHEASNERGRMIQCAESCHSESGPSDPGGQSITIISCNSPEAIASQSAPGMTVLYRAVDQGRISRLFDNQGNLDHIPVLWSIPESDFSRSRTTYYFTNSFDVAKRNAAWIKRRANGGSVVVVRIAVRNSVIENMPPDKVQRIFWPNPEWKELVWRCYNRKQIYNSKELAKYSDAALIIGTIANKPKEYYYNYSSSAQLTEDCLLKAGDQAVQFAFSSEEDGESLLFEQAKNTIKLFSFTEADLEEWMKE